MIEKRIHYPTCNHCQALPMETATQIIPGPNGMVFANIFCGSCGVSIGVCFVAVAQVEQSKIVRPS